MAVDSEARHDPATDAASAGQSRCRDRFLTALSQALLVPYGLQDDVALVDQVGVFLVAQRRGLPHVLPIAMQIACIAMDLSTLPTRGRRFRKLPLSTRATVTAGWRRSRLSFLRNFLKFHEVFAGYIVYSKGDAP